MNTKFKQLIVKILSFVFDSNLKQRNKFAICLFLILRKKCAIKEQGVYQH